MSGDSVRVVVVHDYLTQKGGAERVALSMARAFPDAPLVTSVYSPALTFPEFQKRHVIALAPRLEEMTVRRGPHSLLPFLPWVFARADLPDADVVVCSTSGWAHGIRTKAATLVYCHSPARWLYEQRGDYLSDFGLGVRAGFAAYRPFLVGWDKRAARRATDLVANSARTAARIRSDYGREAEVLLPPIGIGPGLAHAVPGMPVRFYLTVARWRRHKHLDVVVEAFRQLPDRLLVVVGDDLPGHLDVPPNVMALGQVSDERLRWLYSNCTALVSAAQDDFGLTPVEANAFGRPTVVLRDSGFVESQVQGLTGLFVDEPDPAAFAHAVREVERRPWQHDKIRAHGLAFSEESFMASLRARVAALLP